MSTRDDDLVPDDLADLFAAERHRPAAEAPTDDLEVRLWSRIVATTGPFPGGGGAGGGHDPGGNGGPGLGHDPATGGRGGAGPVAGLSGGDSVGPAPIGSIAPAGATAVAGASVAKVWLGTTAAKIAFTAAVFIAGGATSVVVEHAVMSPSPIAVAAAAPSSVTAPAAERSAPVPDLVELATAATSAALPLAASASAAAPATDAPTHVTGPASAAPHVASSAAAGSDRDADLAAERSLLERARTALGRGDANGAVEALGQHAARFPRGRLGEEREALWIQALVASGRTDESRARFERFRSRHPQSLLVQALEATLGR